MAPLEVMWPPNGTSLKVPRREGQCFRPFVMQITLRAADRRYISHCLMREEHAMSATKKSELLNCELGEQELDKATGGGAKNQSRGVSESLSLSFSEIKFEYTTAK
jgi:hypothetical protein